MDQFCIQRNHGVKFGENRSTVDPCPLYNFKFTLINGTVIKLGMNVYSVNLNYITKYFYGRFIIASESKIGPLKKICLGIIISFKILLPRCNRHEHA